MKLGTSISPVYAITAQMPPTLIIHGDADQRVPLQQAQSFVTQAASGAIAQLIVKPGAAHDWLDQERRPGSGRLV